MFSFVVNRLSFLKDIPLAAIFFDCLIKLWMLATNSKVLDWIDELERMWLQQNNSSTHIHRYGGLQFNCNNKEYAHVHSNGLLDMLLSKSLKEQLMREGRVQDHHVFENTGWISFYIKNEDDFHYAISLLELNGKLSVSLKK